MSLPSLARTAKPDQQSGNDRRTSADAQSLGTGFEAEFVHAIAVVVILQVEDQDVSEVLLCNRLVSGPAWRRRRTQTQACPQHAGMTNRRGRIELPLGVAAVAHTNKEHERNADVRNPQAAERANVRFENEGRTTVKVVYAEGSKCTYT